MKFIDNLLNQITMYRLTVYYLIMLLCVALFLSFFQLVGFSPMALIVSTALIVATGYITNRAIGYFLAVPTNTESFLITTLILTLIITPSEHYVGYPFLVAATGLAIASKYLLTYKNKHIFNPAAIAVVVTSLFFGQSASWWVGTTYLMPFVLVGGLLLVRKIQREDLVFTFLLSALAVTFFFSLMHQSSILTTLTALTLHSSLLFLGFVMLTEPLTTPPTKRLQAIYGAIVGLLFSPNIALGPLVMTPEIALCIGNIFAFVVSPKIRLKLFMQKSIAYGEDTVDYIFSLPQKISFTPGQYLEWTIPHDHTDSRGNRRYFTIASSPTESQMHLGVRFYPDGSSFKKALKSITATTPVLVGSLGGDFVLPDDPKKKLVFLAGGIGITPYRAMIKYLTDANQKRDIVLFYANKTEEEIAYTDVFDEAQKAYGLRTVYTLTDEASIPTSWKGEKGRISGEMIKKYVPDYLDRWYYLSGPHGMVTYYEELLHMLHVPSSHIKKDFFPGFV